MNFYRITFKANESFVVQARDAEEAQEVAICTLEGNEIVHSEVVGIVRTEAPVGGQYIGMTRDGFAMYIGVEL